MRILCLALALLSPALAQNRFEAEDAKIRAVLKAAPPLPLQRAELAVKPPREGWGMEMVSSTALDGKGTLTSCSVAKRPTP